MERVLKQLWNDSLDYLVENMAIFSRDDCVANLPLVSSTPPHFKLKATSLKVVKLYNISNMESDWGHTMIGGECQSRRDTSSQLCL